MIFLILINVSFAKVVKIQQGEPAPFTGAILDNEELNRYRQLDEKDAVREAQVKNLNDLRIIQDERIEFYQLQVKEVRKELLKSESSRWLTNIGYFVLGVAITGFAAKAAIESTR